MCTLFRRTTTEKRYHWYRSEWRQHPVELLTVRRAMHPALSRPSKRICEFLTDPNANDHRNSFALVMNALALMQTMALSDVEHHRQIVATVREIKILHFCFATKPRRRKLTDSSSLNSVLTISTISLMNNKSTLTWNSCISIVKYLNCLTSECGMIRWTMLHSTNGFNSIEEENNFAFI